MQTIKYVFQPHGDERGQLVALEEFKTLIFEKSVYSNSNNKMHFDNIYLLPT